MVLTYAKDLEGASFQSTSVACGVHSGNDFAVATRVGESGMKWMLSRGVHAPEELNESWAYLRQLGRRREQLITAETASMHRIEDFLAVAWPTVTETCAQPLKSVTWLAALQVVTSRSGGRPGRLTGMGSQAFIAAVRGGVPDWGGKTDCRRIAVGVFNALTSTDGVVAWSRRGLLRRVADELDDLQHARAQLRAVEGDMVGVLDELGLSRLADIPALTAVGAAAILAEVGDPHRYDSSSSLVMYVGSGWPGSRLTVWRTVWPMLQSNPVMAAKYQAMTKAAEEGAGGPQNASAAAAARARCGEAHAECAASLLSWIYSMVVHDTSWRALVAYEGAEEAWLRGVVPGAAVR